MNVIANLNICQKCYRLRYEEEGENTNYVCVGRVLSFSVDLGLGIINPNGDRLTFGQYVPKNCNFRLEHVLTQEKVNKVDIV